MKIHIEDERKNEREISWRTEKCYMDKEKKWERARYRRRDGERGTKRERDK